MPIDLERCAQQEAACECYRIVESHGVDDGLAIIRGKAIAYLRSVAAVSGWSDVHALICERAPSALVPVRGEKIYLAVSNTAEIISTEIGAA